MVSAISHQDYDLSFAYLTVAELANLTELRYCTSRYDF